MLMNKKSDYISPEVDVFSLLSEGVICQSTDPNNLTETLDGDGFDFFEL